MRLFESYGREAKAAKLLNRKVFRLAAQLPAIEPAHRTRLAREILQNGADASKERLTALAQAKIAYCGFALKLAHAYGAQAFATMVPQGAHRPTDANALRKDYSFLFERFFYFLNGLAADPMGYLIFDELDRAKCHILLEQVSNYFVRTQNGRARSRLIIPEPFFVHSDLTTLVQLADIIAYTISWGVRLNGMTLPARDELAPIGEAVKRIRFQRRTEGGETHWGFKVIDDLRPRDIRPI